MTMSKASFTRDGDLGELVIDSPPLNLLDMELADDLRAAIDEAAGADVRAIFVHAEGDNFSAGADVQIFLDRDESDARQLLDGFVAMIRQFESIDVPSVCAVQGLCLAAGLELALTCDLIWAAEGSNLGLVEAVIGATPFGGGTQRLVARAGAGRALEAVLTGRPYPAETMREWGVVNRVLPADDLQAKARAFAQRLAEGPTVAHAATKRLVRTALDDGVEAADAALPVEGARVMSSEDLQAGARSLLEQGPGKASFKGR
jgi:enoyl-CoA hydratase/carnithine racemase